MELENSHGGYAGPTLIEKIQDQVDIAFSHRQELKDREIDCELQDFSDGVAEGVLVGLTRALSILRSSSEASEWTEAATRHGIIAAGGTVPRSVAPALVIDGTMPGDDGVQHKVRVVHKIDKSVNKSVNKRDKYIAKFKELGLSMDLDSLSDNEIEAIARDCGIKI